MKKNYIYQVLIFISIFIILVAFYYSFFYQKNKENINVVQKQNEEEINLDENILNELINIEFNYLNERKLPEASKIIIKENINLLPIINQNMELIDVITIYDIFEAFLDIE